NPTVTRRSCRETSDRPPNRHWPSRRACSQSPEESEAETTLIGVRGDFVTRTPGHQDQIPSLHRLRDGFPPRLPGQIFVAYRSRNASRISYLIRGARATLSPSARYSAQWFFLSKREGGNRKRRCSSSAEGGELSALHPRARGELFPALSRQHVRSPDNLHSACH